jgi:hypothetical protein
MSRKRYLSLCVLVLASSFAGGYIASRAIPVVHAQILPRAPIRATAFTLVDAQGKVQATLRSAAPGAELTLDDANGKSRVEISVSNGIVIRDGNGRTVWSSPRGFGILPASE